MFRTALAITAGYCYYQSNIRYVARDHVWTKDAKKWKLNKLYLREWWLQRMPQHIVTNSPNPNIAPLIRLLDPIAAKMATIERIAGTENADNHLESLRLEIGKQAAQLDKAELLAVDPDEIVTCYQVLLSQHLDRQHERQTQIHAAVDKSVSALSSTLEQPDSATPLKPRGAAA